MSKKSKNFIPQQGNTYQSPKTAQNGTKKKKWDKTHTIVFILILFWSIGSILGSIGFVNSCTSTTYSNNVVYADEVVENQNFTLNLSPFNASVRFVAQFLSGSTSYVLASNYDETLYNLKVSFNNGYITSANVNFNDFLFGDINSSGISSLLGQGTNEYYNINIDISNQTDRSLYVFNNLTSQLEAYSLIDGVHFKYSMQRPVTFNGILSNITISMPNSMRITSTNFNRIDFFSSKTNIYTNVMEQSLIYHYMRYYNDLNQYIDVYYNVYDSRNITYNYTRFINSVQDLTNNEYYNLGYTTGYNEGDTIGFQNGLELGKEVGYYEGKQDGILEGTNGNYTFLGLMSSVIDAPIRALSGLLEFEILGINFSDFFFGILTACLFIAVCKIVIKSVV